jgi:hypothetical protein
LWNLSACRGEGQGGLGEGGVSMNHCNESPMVSLTRLQRMRNNETCFNHLMSCILSHTQQMLRA